MKKKLFIAALWIACGIYNWGTTMAYFDYQTCILRLPSSKHAGLAALEALGGPFGTVVVACNSNFNQHGWRLW